MDLNNATKQKKSMKWLLFASRVALICNAFFLLTVLLHFRNFIEDQVTISFIIIIGYFLAVFIFNPLVNLTYALLLARRKNLFDIVPRWLVITNFIFLLLELQYILFLNDTFHT